MDKLTLGAQIKQAYPGSYDDMSEAELADLVLEKYGRAAGVDPADDIQAPQGVWDFISTPLAPEIPREKFMPADPNSPSGRMMQLPGEVAYQFYRAMVRPATSPLGAGMGAAMAVPGVVRTGALAAMGVMGLTGAAESINRLSAAESHGQTLDAAVDLALSGLMTYGGFRGATLPSGIREAPLWKIPKIYREWKQWQKMTPEQQAALGGESTTTTGPRQLELPYPGGPFRGWDIWGELIQDKTAQSAAPGKKPLSDPWYTFRSIRGLGDKLFKAGKGQKAPSAIPAQTFMDAVNNPQMIPPGDAYWLGLQELAERKSRSGEKVSWLDIMNTIQDNLSISQVYRGSKSGSAWVELPKQYAEEHPDWIKAHDDIADMEAKTRESQKYSETFGMYVKEKVSELINGLWDQYKLDDWRSPGKIPKDLAGLFTDTSGYRESYKNDVISNICNLPEYYYNDMYKWATEPRENWSYYANYVNQVMKIIDKKFPGVGGLMRIWADLQMRNYDTAIAADNAKSATPALRQRLEKEYRDKVGANQSSFYEEEPGFRNYGIKDGEDYETNSVIVSRRSFDGVDQKLQMIGERVEQINGTIAWITGEHPKEYNYGQGMDVGDIRALATGGMRRAGVELAPEQQKAFSLGIDALMEERGRLEQEYQELSEAKQFMDYTPGHFPKKGSIAHYRWDTRLTQSSDGTNEGLTAFAKELQSDWYQSIRENGANGYFKNKDVEKVYGMIERVKVLADQLDVLKNNKSWGAVMSQLNEKEPVFPQWKGLPAQLTFEDLLAREAFADSFHGKRISVDGEVVDVNTLTSQQRQSLITRIEGDIKKLQESAGREADRLWGQWELRKVPIYDYNRRIPGRGYEIRGYDYQWHRIASRADYYNQIGPFVDDINKTTDIMLKAFVRRALEKGIQDGRQYEYIGMIGGKLSAFSQGYGTPWHVIDVAPSTGITDPNVAYQDRSYLPTGQRTMGQLYNVRVSTLQRPGQGETLWNMTMEDIVSTFGEETAKKIASQGWGKMEGTPNLQELTFGDVSHYWRWAQERRKTKPAQIKIFKTQLASNGYIWEMPEGKPFNPEDGRYFRIPEESWELMPPHLQRYRGEEMVEDLSPWVPRRIHLDKTVVLPGYNGPTYRGQVAAYDILYKSVLQKLAKEWGTTLEPARVWGEGNRGRVRSQSGSYWGDWYDCWRLKVTPKMIESVLYNQSPVNP